MDAVVVVENVTLSHRDDYASLQVVVRCKDVTVKVGDIAVDRKDAERIVNFQSIAAHAQKTVGASCPA